MEKVVVKQVRSEIGRSERVRRVLDALGLGRIGREKTIAHTPAVAGMIRRVGNLLEVRKVK